MLDNNIIIENVEDPISSQEAIVRSSVQILNAPSPSVMPTGFGSGFILVHKERTFLITVYHVIKGYQSNIFLETNEILEGRPILKPVGNFYHFAKTDLPKVDGITDLAPILDQPGKDLDFAFTEVSPPLNLLQEYIDFGFFKVQQGTKIFIGAESAKDPDKNQTYGFYGKIQQDVRGVLLYSRPTFKYNLTYHRTEGDFHIFLAPEKAIVASSEYKGCSGAPILDWDGKLVAIACLVKEGTKLVYGFSISKCLALIDSALAYEASLPTK